jgi:hypothetical protein
MYRFSDSLPTMVRRSERLANQKLVRVNADNAPAGGLPGNFDEYHQNDDAEFFKKMEIVLRVTADELLPAIRRLNSILESKIESKPQ